MKFPGFLAEFDGALARASEDLRTLARRMAIIAPKLKEDFTIHGAQIIPPGATVTSFERKTGDDGITRGFASFVCGGPTS